MIITHFLCFVHLFSAKAPFIRRKPVLPGENSQSQVNFSECFYEKTVDPFAEPKAKAHALTVNNRARARSDCLA